MWGVKEDSAGQGLNKRPHVILPFCQDGDLCKAALMSLLGNQFSHDVLVSVENKKLIRMLVKTVIGQQTRRSPEYVHLAGILPCYISKPVQFSSPFWLLNDG